MTAIRTFLAGIRVLDLSQYIPGPLGTLLLADLGAEILKIEPPQGDPMQDLGPRDGQGRPLFYETMNAGKSVRRLDLKSEAGAARLRDLARDADVLVEGFRPEVMTRLGLDYVTLSAINPRLVWCSLSGYGAAGPDALKAGHDANYLAEAGVLDRNGHDAPIYFDPPIADMTGGVFAALAIVGALHGRQRTGRGCSIDLALADVIHPLQLLQIADLGANGRVPKRGETYLNSGAAYYRVYATRDGGHVVIGAVEPKFWCAFAEAAERPEWIARQQEPIPQTALIVDVAARLAELTLADCDERFGAVDCCYSRVVPLDTAIGSRRVAARGLVRPAGDERLQALFPALVDGAPPLPREPVRPADAGLQTGGGVW